MILDAVMSQVLEENPDKFSPGNVERVSKLLEYETNHPGKRKPYRYFEEFGDWQLYFDIHPAWQGRTAKKCCLQSGRSICWC